MVCRRAGTSCPDCGAQLRSAHVAQIRHLPVHAGLDDHVAELLRLHQPALRHHGVLEIEPCRRRRLPDLAGRHLDVLLAQHLDHIAGREIARRQLVGIQPDAHAVILLAELQHVADAVHARQRIADLDGGEVAQVELIVIRLPVAGSMSEKRLTTRRMLGRLLLDGDAGRLDDVGQRRQRLRHAILHQSTWAMSRLTPSLNVTMRL